MIKQRNVGLFAVTIVAISALSSVVRIDYNHSERHRFEAIHSNNASNFPNDTFNNTGEPFPGLPGVGQFPRRKRWSFAWNWAPTSTINNELRGGAYRQISRFINNRESPEGYVLTWPTIGSALTNPVRTTQNSGRDGNITDFADNASWVKGSHFVRFGGSFRHVQLIPFGFAGRFPAYTIGFGLGNINPLNSGAAAQFPGGIASTDFTNATNLLALLTGALTTAAQTFNAVDANSGYVAGAPQRRDLRYYALGFYVGDTWRLRPNLTLNFGLRHDYYNPVRESKTRPSSPSIRTCALPTCSNGTSASSGRSSPTRSSKSVTSATAASS